MSRVFIFLGLISVLSCKENTGKPEQFKSGFNLQSDLTSFKTKMNEEDTLILLVDRSVCMYRAYEKVEITKKKRYHNHRKPF
jgi:thioredoxin-related protein